MVTDDALPAEPAIPEGIREPFAVLKVELRYRWKVLKQFPADAQAQKDFFEPDLSGADLSRRKFLAEKAALLRRLLVYRSPLMPAGILEFCLGYAAKDDAPLAGVFTSVRRRFTDLSKTELPGQIREYYRFRNDHIAHQKSDQLLAPEPAKVALAVWMKTLATLHSAIA